MNIVVLSEVSAERVIAGASRLLREQAHALQRRGHQVTIVTRTPAKDAVPEIDIAGVREHRYPAGSGNELGFVLESFRGSLRGFDAAVAHRPADAVIVHQSLAGLAPVFIRRNHSRFIYCCLSLAPEEYLSRNPRAQRSVRYRLNVMARRWTERLVLGRCERILVLSQFTLRTLMSVYGIKPNRIRLVGGAVDTQRFQPATDRAEIRRRLKLPPNETILFTVRNLVPRMGLDNLLEAMAILRRDLPRRELLLLIGGDGPLRSLLSEAIQRLGLADCVRLLGFVPETSLPAYYQAADLFVLPTQELEGFGLIAVEALACGTPVLGTPVGAIPEILGRVDPALITAGTEPHALAKGLGQLLTRFMTTPVERKRLATKGRALVEKEYTWGRHAEQIEQVLHELGIPAAARMST